MTDTAQAETANEGVKQGQIAKRVLFWAGVAGVSAAVTLVIIRATLFRGPSDPTTERIESLIEEANRLLRALEEKK